MIDEGIGMSDVRGAAHIEVARRVLGIEARALDAVAQRVGAQFGEAVEAILATGGRTVICGMGKSGIVGRKVAATLSSTGTPSFFMHPGEAYHGDLGMVTPQDVFVSISYSGETDEVVKLLSFLKSNGNYLLAITGRPGSTLARAADCHLDVSVAQEACPLQLAPTASTTATLAMGDALAVALMEARGFRPENFARFHPGGSLGRKLLARVEDEMVSDGLPLVGPAASVLDVLHVMTAGRLGLAVVETDEAPGVITDGDIRRAIERHEGRVFEVRAADIMTRSPCVVAVGTRVEDALRLAERRRVSALLVVDQGRLVGIFKK